MNKQSGWVTTICVAAFLLLRIASLSMQHPDWKANDWIGLAGFVLIAAVIIYGGIWLVKKIRTPKPAVAAVASPSTPANVQDSSISVTKTISPPLYPAKICAQCNTQIESDAKFCSECGTVAA